jgi:hypothetical protein
MAVFANPPQIIQGWITCRHDGGQVSFLQIGKNAVMCIREATNASNGGS